MSIHCRCDLCGAETAESDLFEIEISKLEIIDRAISHQIMGDVPGYKRDICCKCEEKIKALLGAMAGEKEAEERLLNMFFGGTK